VRRKSNNWETLPRPRPNPNQSIHKRTNLPRTHHKNQRLAIGNVIEQRIMKTQNIPIPKQEIALLCQKWNIQKFSLFGSVLRDDFTPTSDIDILIEFQIGKTIGFLKLHQLEQELSKIFNGRAIDLVTLKSINHRLRDRILAEAEVYYAER